MTAAWVNVDASASIMIPHWIVCPVRVGCAMISSHSYQIVVRGYVDPDWSDWFEELAIRHNHANGTTTFSGAVADQAALYGVLAKVRDLGLPLISVRLVENPSRPI